MTVEATISAADLAEMAGISTRRLAQLASEKAIPRAGRGRYPHPRALHAYLDRLRAEAERQGDPSAQALLTRERARLAREQADGLAEKNARMRETLIDAAEAEAAWAAAKARVVARFLQMPAEIKAALPQLSDHDVSEIERVMRDALAEFMADAGDEEPVIPRTIPPLH